MAERAIETGSPDELLKLLSDIVRAEVKRRFERVMRLKGQAGGSVEEAREYVEAMLGLQVYSHKLYLSMKGSPREGGEVHG